MSTHLTPLHDEHEELRVWIEKLKEDADRVGDVSVATLRELLDETYTFLIAHLIPHAIAEDEVLYPVVGYLMGAPEATNTMSRDHEEVGRLTEELNGMRRHLFATAPGDLQTKSLRRILYGLYAIVSLHFLKEEELYVPLLDHGLSHEEAVDVFERMEIAERRARGRLAAEAHPGSRSLTA